MMKEHALIKPIPNLLLVASGKGGVGKTWLSITLAHALSIAGQRVLLFDGDLGMANVDIQLGLMPQKDLQTVILNQCALEDAIIKYSQGGFDIIAGRSGAGQLAILSTQKLVYIREEIRRLAPQYDYVIADLGAGVGGTVRTLSEIGHECLLIINDEPTSLTDSYAFMKVMNARCPLLKFQIVVNWTENEAQAHHAYQTLQTSCEAFLKFSPALLGYVRKDNRVKDTIRSQECFLTRHPNSPAAEDISSIATILANKRVINLTA